MLRAVAATMVVFVHIDSELIQLHRQPLGSDWLASGVDIFFVISGFIMWTSVDRRGSMTPREFLKNRVIRIVPLYWLVTGALLLVALIAPQVLRTTVINPFHTISSFLFVPARHPNSGNFWPLVIPGWSLNYEMLFYVVFAAGLAFSPEKKSIRFSLISFILLGVFLIARALNDRVDILNFYSNPILIEFDLGIITAIAWKKVNPPTSYFYLSVIGLGFWLLWAANHIMVPFGTLYIGATLIVGGAILLPSIPENSISRMGDASYSLYLTHALVLAALARAAEHYGLTRPIAYIAVGLASAFAVALLTYRLFELPMTAYLKRIWSAPKQPTAIAPSAKIASKVERTGGL